MLLIEVTILLGEDMADESQQWATLEMQARELFTPAAPIDEKDLFAGRIAQIERLLDAITERGRHAILYGERGVGKTSLANIVQLIVRAQMSRAVFTFKKQVGPTDTYDGMWRKIFRDMQFTTKETLPYGKEQSTSHVISDRYQNLKITPDDVVRELEAIGKYGLPVIIFDEFDKLADADALRDMSHTIKALSDSGLSTTIIIVGVADNITSLVTEHESIKRNIEEIRMPRMSDAELQEILIKRLPRLGIKIEGDAKWKIITLARGLPEYVHLLGSGAAVNAARQFRRVINEDDVDAAINKMLHQTDQSSGTAYKKAIHSNRNDAHYVQVLLACAIAKSDDEGKFTPTAVIEPLSKLLGKKVTIANFANHLAAFCGDARGKILEQHGSARAYKYRFREPKMQPYVIMQGIASALVDKAALSILAAPEQPNLFPAEALSD